MLNKKKGGQPQQKHPPIPINRLPIIKNSSLKVNEFEIAPQNIEAERAVLCTLLLKSFYSIKEDLSKLDTIQLTEDDFYDERNGIVFKAIKEIVADGKEPDAITITDYIEKNNIENLNILYVMGLIDYLPAPTNLITYASIVKKKSLSRQIISKQRECNLILQSGESNIEANQKILQLIQEINELTNQLYNNIGGKSNIVLYNSSPEKAKQKPKTFCNKLFPAGYLSLLAGPSGTGKTYTAINLACQYVAETGDNAFLWLSEDIGQVDFRLETVYNKSWEDKREYLRKRIFFTKATPEYFLTKKYGSTVNNLLAITSFKTHIIDKFNFIVLDPLLNFFGGNENDNSDARQFINTLSDLVKETEKVIIVLHHTSKAGLNDKNNADELKSSIRGASAFVDTVRTACYLKKSEYDSNKREIIVVKSNIGETGRVEEIEMPFNQRRNSYRSEKPI